MGIIINSFIFGSTPANWQYIGATGGVFGTTSGVDFTGCDIVFGFYSGDLNKTFSDSLGNTWVPLTQFDNGVGNAGRWWYCINPTVGAGQTFSVNQAYDYVAAIAFKNTNATPADQEAGAGSSSTSSQQGGSVTPSLDNELVLSGLATGLDSSSQTVNSGFTIADNRNAVAFSNYGGAVAYKIQTTAGAENPTWSWGSGPSTAVVVNETFKVV